jgi:hypothetical protein
MITLRLSGVIYLPGSLDPRPENDGVKRIFADSGSNEARPMHPCVTQTDPAVAQSATGTGYWTPAQRSAVIASFLARVFDAFDFFLMVLVLHAVAAEWPRSRNSYFHLIASASRRLERPTDLICTHVAERRASSSLTSTSGRPAPQSRIETRKTGHQRQSTVIPAGAWQPCELFYNGRSKNRGRCPRNRNAAMRGNGKTAGV